ncbi:hypothetical protein BJ508DRAFT_306070 [Ascobolus immersus RN42]|uniref:Uncharacterized protein n=1 Tax=Ascobolus immersus RN42 TaxID=1160509 RepID=A0A3N4I765_ASCIM|nr:hypothetical protein BJ508DRAFT_306070 [Ascobolus immersus RN42]
MLLSDILPTLHRTHPHPPTIKDHPSLAHPIYTPYLPLFNTPTYRLYTPSGPANLLDFFPVPPGQPLLDTTPYLSTTLRPPQKDIIEPAWRIVPTYEHPHPNFALRLIQCARLGRGQAQEFQRETRLEMVELADLLWPVPKLPKPGKGPYQMPTRTYSTVSLAAAGVGFGEGRVCDHVACGKSMKYMYALPNTCLLRILKAREVLRLVQEREGLGMSRFGRWVKRRVEWGGRRLSVESDRLMEVREEVMMECVVAIVKKWGKKVAVRRDALLDEGLKELVEEGKDELEEATSGSGGGGGLLGGDLRPRASSGNVRETWFSDDSEEYLGVGVNPD